LLKEALNGNCRTAMIAHISPANVHFEESYNTLNCAARLARLLRVCAVLLTRLSTRAGRAGGGMPMQMPIAPRTSRRHSPET
jgi:hypothetical protein